MQNVNVTKKIYPLYELLAIVLLCCLGIVAYSNSLNGSFHFDDESSIVVNLNIKNLSNLGLIWDFAPTRFITYLSFAFNYHLHQLHVFGYHLFNLISHLSVTILVWWFAFLTLATPAMKKNKISKHANLIAFFIAAVFVAHPIQTEAVNYIVQRSSGLATLFYLLTLCLYIKSRILKIEKPDYGQKINFYYFASLITASVGMFTKEIIITLPFMILLYEFCFLRISSGLNWKRILPFFIISLIVPLVLFYTSSENSRKMIQLLKSAPDIPRWNYLLTQPRVMITYLRLLFIPLNQNLDYDYPVTHTFFEPPVLASFLFLLVILTAAIRIFHKHRLIAFAIFYFFLTLLPESSVVPLADVIFEHRLYLPMLGYSIFLVTIMYYLFKNKNLGVVILILIISGYAILTYSRNFAWQDDITLSKDLTLKSAKKPRTYVQLGNAYAKKKMYNQAIESLIKATELAPNYSEAYYNLGGVYYEKNDPDKAIFYLNQAIQLDPLDFQAYYFRGMSFGDKKEYAQAIADFNQALRLNPKYIESYRALAYTYQAIKNNDEAIIVYNKAIAINPGVAEVYIYAAEFCNGIGKYQMAMDLCKIALKINPNSHAVHFNLGYTYENMGNFDQAIKSFQKALTINPDSGSTYNLLSWAYYNIKNYNLAIQYYDKAIQLGYPANPNFLESLKNTNRKQTQNTQI